MLQLNLAQLYRIENSWMKIPVEACTMKHTNRNRKTLKSKFSKWKSQIWNHNPRGGWRWWKSPTWHLDLAHLTYTKTCTMIYTNTNLKPLNLNCTLLALAITYWHWFAMQGGVHDWNIIFLESTFGCNTFGLAIFGCNIWSCDNILALVCFIRRCGRPFATLFIWRRMAFTPSAIDTISLPGSHITEWNNDKTSPQMDVAPLC